MEKVKTTLEEDRLQHELVTQILKDTENLDPDDPKSVVRLGVIAEVVSANPRLFGVDMRDAALRLERLARDLHDGALAVVRKKLEDSRAEIAALEKSKAEMIRQRDSLAQNSTASQNREQRSASSAPPGSDTAKVLEILKQTIADQDLRIARLKSVNA